MLLAMLLLLLLPWRCACYLLFAILLRMNNNTEGSTMQHRRMHASCRRLSLAPRRLHLQHILRTLRCSKHVHNLRITDARPQLLGRLEQFVLVYIFSIQM